MELSLFCLAVLAYSLLVLMTSIHPRRSRLSEFELARRKKGEHGVEQEVLREAHYEDIAAWLRICSGLLVVAVVLLLVASLGWSIGIIVAVVGVLEYVAIANLPFIHRWGQRLYDRYESKLLAIAATYGGRLAFLRGVASGQTQGAVVTLDSREELTHLIEQSGRLLTKEEKQLLASGLAFGERVVADGMTPRTVIDTVEKDELLGPLILDELHKTGHSRFPVIDGDVDHVVGVLHLRDLISLKTKESARASMLMKTPVYYIKDTQTLQHALAAFLKTHHLLFVVVNEYRETVGVITLEDVLEALLGRKIMDEFDAHEDLRAVAARNPKGNNQPNKHHDV
ncbi:MAG: CBS domain-containing protein [Candidatus Saccharimonadales bacterium]